MANSYYIVSKIREDLFLSSKDDIIATLINIQQVDSCNAYSEIPQEE